MTIFLFKRKQYISKLHSKQIAIHVFKNSNLLKPLN